MPDASLWTLQLTRDGSYTFFSEEFGETFHSRDGAKEEAFQKFAQATELVAQAQSGHICLLDVCYGLGYNTAAALETIWATNPHCQVELYALELDASVPMAAIAPELLQSWSPAVQEILRTIAQTHRYQQPYLEATLLLGDARQTVQSLAQAGWQADAIFFDPFSPRRCPQLWTVEFFQQVARCLAASGKLATYSRSAAVRSALQAAQLQIGTMPLGDPNRHQAHEWSQGTVAAWDTTGLHPLSLMEQEHLRTRAAVPYHDIGLCNSAATIHQRHREDQESSSLESTSSWRRRWGIR